MVYCYSRLNASLINYNAGFRLFRLDGINIIWKIEYVRFISKLIKSWKKPQSLIIDEYPVLYFIDFLSDEILKSF